MILPKRISLAITFMLGILLIIALALSSFDIPRLSYPSHSEKEELVADSIKRLLSDQILSPEGISAQLYQKVTDGEFKAVEGEQIDVAICKNQPINDVLELFGVDVFIQRDTGIQWVQFDALWQPSEKKLMDLRYRPIDYLARLNSEAASTDGLQVAQQIISSISTPDPALMGWRYKKTGPGMDGIRDVKIVSLLPLGSYIPQGGKEATEVAVIAQYQVSLFDYTNLVESILYLKKYGERWQLEDIRLLDVKRVSSP